MAIFGAGQTITIPAGDEFRLDAIYGQVSISISGATAIDVGTAATFHTFPSTPTMSDSTITTQTNEIVWGEFVYRNPA